MSLPREIFPASELPERMRANAKGHLRKGLVQKDLKECELLELLQYQCDVENEKKSNSVVRCWPYERLFRRCQDRNGSFMVETTAWEGSDSQPKK